MAKRKRGSTTEPLRRLTERFEALRRDADRLLEAAGEEEPEAEDEPPRLDAGEANSGRAGKTIAQRARDASSLFDTGREELFTSLEAQVAKRIAPLLERLEIPRRAELDELVGRVAEIERKLAALERRGQKTGKRRS